MTTPFLLRSDNGLVFSSRRYTALVRMKQEFITPYCPQQSGMVERVIRTLKEQCIHHHRFESQQHASRAISDWIQFYNTRRQVRMGQYSSNAELPSLRWIKLVARMNFQQWLA